MDIKQVNQPTPHTLVPVSGEHPLVLSLWTLLFEEENILLLGLHLNGCWVSVLSVLPEKTANIKAHGCTELAMCLGCSNMCISTGCKHAGEIPPIASQIQVCFPLEWSLHTYADFVFTWKTGTHKVFGTVCEKFQKSFPWCFWAC